MLGTVKSALLGSKIRVLVTLLLALGVVVGGGLSLGVLGAPSVVGVHNSFGDVTEETTEIRTELVVRNPNPVGINLGGVSVSYDVTMNDVAMANGTKEGVSVGTGNSTVNVSTRMDNERIPAWWVSHVRNGEETALRVDATVRSSTLGRSFQAPPVERQISTDVISQFNSTEPRPIDADQPLVSDPVGYVNETSARWGEVTASETPIDMRFTVYNAKSLPMAVTEIGYTITMNNITVGNGSSETGHVIEGHSTETIETRTAIRNGKLDQWWVSHLENDQVTDLRIDFYAELELGGETFRVPLEDLTYRKTIETDIFGNKAESSGSTTGSEARTADDSKSGGETTAGDGSETTANDDSATTTDGDTATTTTANDGATGGETTTTDDGLLSLSVSGLR
ncbi:LEA type 2 family protein [Halorussus gelatinilyticus]|uniref:LEA type 2 family protein n=1 Tax=Halorussus gelatinilyticus TaxID=2937524 RepID=A0A8U0IHQ0_9EURY|nr:LEA type 2 family protein [Halorussus gelatinilyticus]UPW00201.1 LEA type 2 family protein [Halorussus gelatinilyticus]